MKLSMGSRGYGAAVEPRRYTKYVYIVDKPGHDLDGEDTMVGASSRQEADARAKSRALAWNCKLRYVGTYSKRGYKFEVPSSELPQWAREIAELTEVA